MLKLSNEALMDRVAMASTFRKAMDYHKQDRIKEIRVSSDYRHYVARIKGSRLYETDIMFNEEGEVSYASCNCLAYESYYGDCKHIMALLLSLRDYDEKGLLKYKRSEGNIKNILEKFNTPVGSDLAPVYLEVNVELEYGDYFLSLRFGGDKLYVVKDLKSFLANIKEGRIMEFGKNFTYYPNKHEINPRDKEVIEFLDVLSEVDDLGYYHDRRGGSFKGKRLELGSNTLKNLLDLLEGRPFNFTNESYQYKDIEIRRNNLDIAFLLEEDGEDLILRIEDGKSLVLLTREGEYILYDGQVYRISQEQRAIITPLWREMEERESRLIRIEEGLKESFVSEIMPRIKTYSNLSIDERVSQAIYNPPLQASIYFDRKEDTILGKVIYNYGDIEINPFSSKETGALSLGKILVRDLERERIIMSLLEEGNFKVEDGGFYLEEEEEIFDFINDIIPRLQEYCHIFYSESFRKIDLINSQSFKSGIRLNSDIDMLEFNFDIDGIDLSQLGNIFQAIREKKKYYKLKEGAFLSIDDKEFQDVLDMLDYLNVDSSQLERGRVQIPKFRTIYLDSFIKDRDMGFIKRNVDFKRLVRDIKQPDEIRYDLPLGLKADLRDYQKFGFKWLKTLASYGFGGILADEMGLGKTLQMIALLLSEKEEKGRQVSLIVVPSSLIFNWEEEVKRFAPDLDTLLVIGSKNERRQLISSARDYDLLVTSYPLIRRDVDDYQDINFRYCILDEAQHIKNQSSINARSVKNIKAKGFFALTGTPMENSLSELWSIFDFLMPGYLLSNKKFTDKFERPIVKENDNERLRDLNRHIRPFILRRLKKEVLRELPDKIEQKLLVDMLPEQKKVYLAYLQSLKGELDDEISNYGYNKSQLKILAGLTRLRQLCCHPSVFLEDYKGGSGKLDSLEEIVEEALDGGHRILIFSQFTSILGKIRNRLEGKQVHCLYLDGSTPLLTRGDLVRDFNKGIGDVFLISLKAGGTGLNLTSADMVIHFDPWWNPAVEDQATDRAHRIGQENRVQVIKLIAKGTIEEKIFQLQERKKEMIDRVITEGESLISKLSEKEIMSLFDL